jgi:hypothetical protein
MKDSYFGESWHRICEKVVQMQSPQPVVILTPVIEDDVGEGILTS